MRWWSWWCCEGIWFW